MKIAGSQRPGTLGGSQEGAGIREKAEKKGRTNRETSF